MCKQCTIHYLIRCLNIVIYWISIICECFERVVTLQPKSKPNKIMSKFATTATDYPSVLTHNWDNKDHKISPSFMAKLIWTKARTIQEACIKVRKELFYDQISGFDHNIGGVRTKASVKKAEARIDNLTGGLVRFKFRSHRLLWFTIQGVDKRYIIECTNKYDYNVKDSEKSNPYLTIEKELNNAASEMMMIEQAYKQLLKAA